MFESKKTKLIEVSSKTSKTSASTTMTVSDNPFVRQGIMQESVTTSGNGALKYSTTGSDFVDQFGALSRYRTPRPFAQIHADMAKLWVKSPILALCFVFYLRMITRVVSFFDGTKTENPQRGAGLKHEAIFRYMWVAVNHPDTFWKNITYFIAVGSWKDIITMLSYDLQYNGWSDRKLDWNKLGMLLLAGLENPNQVNLVKKYIPKIQSNSACKTIESQADNIIAKWLCSLLFGGKAETYKNYKSYRLLKTSGTAHQWQQLISQGKMLQINFDTIHGRALSQLVSGKFLKNQGLETRYAEWITKKPVAKFTGFVYELVENISSTMAKYQKDTINAQFQQLVAVASVGLQTNKIRPISVIDGSGSMNSLMYLGGGKTGKLRSLDVAMSSALFFDEMMLAESPFKGIFLSFSGETRMHHFAKADNFVDSYVMTNRNAGGGTNFQSVFDYLVRFKQGNNHVDENLIPNFIVVWSDGEFNGVGRDIKTNVEAGRLKLRAAGYSEEYCANFGICFVDLPNTFYNYSHFSGPKFETFADAKNCFYFSGYDLSPLAFLFGVNDQKSLPSTAEEMFLAAMDQEVLRRLEV